jgi:hypothetical protein
MNIGVDIKFAIHTISVLSYPRDAEDVDEIYRRISYVFREHYLKPNRLTSVNGFWNSKKTFAGSLPAYTRKVFTSVSPLVFMKCNLLPTSTDPFVVEKTKCFQMWCKYVTFVEILHMKTITKRDLKYVADSVQSILEYFKNTVPKLESTMKIRDNESKRKRSQFRKEEAKKKEARKLAKGTSNKKRKREEDHG